MHMDMNTIATATGLTPQVIRKLKNPDTPEQHRISRTAIAERLASWQELKHPQEKEFPRML